MESYIDLLLLQNKTMNLTGRLLTTHSMPKLLHILLVISLLFHFKGS